MRLLISNDDGVFAEGIQCLANTLAIAGHEVTVVCPDRERSATGHGLTLHDPIRAEPVTGIFDAAVKVWACSGTPADCVKLALGALVEDKPDFVLAGINHGPNLGTDVLCSGTVSAAMEGLLEKIPSMAMSLADFTSRNFDIGAAFARDFLEHYSKTHGTAEAQPPMLLNVNIPAVTADKITGVAIARLTFRQYFDSFEQRTDPRGRHYYWLAGEALKEIDLDLGQPIADEYPTDVTAVSNNYISVTPLHFNLTAHQQLAPWNAELKGFEFSAG
ncbi:MAG: 5'/3'-nucleotidase SurE [Cyanobacteria bacterium P01_D01_bin.73]